MLTPLSGRFVIIAAVMSLFAPNTLAAPPRIVRAIPDHGDIDIDPSLTEIVIEFDQDMSQDGFSLCGGGPSFPRVTAKPRWVSARECVVGIALQSNSLYELSINCPIAQNFKNKKGEPAEIYTIRFRTGDAAPAAERRKLTDEHKRKALATLRAALDARYAYRDIHRVDWDAAFREHAAAAHAAETPAAFARVLARLLERTNDLHVWVEVHGVVIAAARRSVKPNIDLKSLSSMVREFRRMNDCLSTGLLDGEIGYALLPTWNAECAALLAPLDAMLSGAAARHGVILDLRLNSGGDESLAARVASRFIERPTVYSMHEWAGEADGDSKRIDRTVSPRTEGGVYPGRVAVLMGPANMSSCESFLLMMKQAPRARLFGDRSYGSSGNPKPLELGEGIAVFLSSWRDYLPDGTLLEGRGVDPDEAIAFRMEESGVRDPVLESALRWLRE